MREISRTLVFAVLAFAVLQLFPVDVAAPPDSDPLVIENAEVAEVVGRACVDCHTNHPDWPWYAQVAPASWITAGHVREGRSKLNFATWGELAVRRQYSKLGQVVDHVESREMPLRSYTWGHPEARLTAEERQTLVEWAESLRVELRAASQRSRGGDEEEPRSGGGT